MSRVLKEPLPKLDVIAQAIASKADFDKFKDSPDPLDMSGVAWESESFRVESRDGDLYVGIYPVNRTSDAAFVVCVDMLADKDWLRMLRSHYKGPFASDAEIALSCSQARFAGRECRVRVLADKPEAIGIKVSHQ